jgi:hypothetical protein
MHFSTILRPYRSRKELFSAFMCLENSVRNEINGTLLYVNCHFEIRKILVGEDSERACSWRVGGEIQGVW